MRRKNIPVIAMLAIFLAVPMFSRAAGADVVTSATPPKTEAAAQSAQPRARLSAFSADQPYTLAEMLNYAVRDERAAQALYSGAAAIAGSGEPFARFLQEETGFIEQLTRLMTENGLALPDMTASGGEPAVLSLREACLAGIRAESVSIEMYSAFLAKDGLPDSVREVFQLLLASSRSHLDALTKVAVGEGWLQATQYRGDGDDDSDYEDREDDDDSDDDDHDDDDDSQDDSPDDGDDD